MSIETVKSLNNERMLPCPLCDKEELVIYVYRREAHEHFKIKCKCGLETRLCGSRKEAVTFWNDIRRPSNSNASAS